MYFYFYILFGTLLLICKSFAVDTQKSDLTEWISGGLACSHEASTHRKCCEGLSE